MQKNMMKDDLRVRTGGELNWINWVKVLCMFFIFVNHAAIYCHVDSGIGHYYFPFFVNAFFVASGYLFFRKYLPKQATWTNRKEWVCSGDGGTLLGNVFFRILVPTMLFSALNFFPKKILRGEEILLSDLLNDTVLGGSIWFTNALAVAELLLFVGLLFRWRRMSQFLLYGLLMACAAYGLFQCGGFVSESNVPFYYKSGMSATFLLALGGLYGLHETAVDRFFSGWRTVLLPCLFVGYLCACTFFYDFYSGSLDTEPLSVTGLGFIVVSVYLIIRLCKALPGSRFVDYWGRHSIGIYFFCGAIPNIMAVVLAKTVALPPTAYLWLCTFLSLGVALVAVYILNRFVPWVYDLRHLTSKR
jgi:peptidoglycan/LPS O-acetylase OafA/YrhL